MSAAVGVIQNWQIFLMTGSDQILLLVFFRGILIAGGGRYSLDSLF